MKYWIVGFLLVFLGGCASMTEEECLQANPTSWESRGLYDGRDGWDPDQRLAMHQEACQEVYVQPDRTSYMRGWSRGVLDYCTPESAYAVGLRGSSGNPRICPREMIDLFEDNNEIGRRIYDLKNQIGHLHEEISGYEKKLKNPALDKDTRRDLHTRIRNRDSELSHLRMLLREAEAVPLFRH